LFIPLRPDHLGRGGNCRIPAAYASLHCSPFRRCRLAQMLWSSRSVGVSFTRAPPCGGQCSGIRSGCGYERRARQAQAPFTARRGGCLDVRCLEKVLRRARSPHRRGATAQRRSPGAARVGELGNLETWDPAARSRDSPGCQDSRFSVPRPGGDLGGRERRAWERARAGAGGNLANWKPGTRRNRVHVRVLVTTCILSEQ
jgi:hypothetical protein